MLRLTDITAPEQIYAYQTHFPAPNFFPTDFDHWLESFEQDTDGEGRTLFRNLRGTVACDGEVPVGFIQYGTTALGFDPQGELSGELSLPVIRSLYFDEGREDAGRVLLQQALDAFRQEKTVYAFFHYFGMSCFARHGKLFGQFRWIQELLYAQGFEIEHQNVYYSSLLGDKAGSDVEIVAHDLTPGSQQTLDFLLRGTQIGGCEVHFLPASGAVYLRWIYVNDSLQNQGLGSACMRALKRWLRDQGMTRLDTDTALENLRACHYYEKNGFTREGITRSFLFTR